MNSVIDFQKNQQLMPKFDTSSKTILFMLNAELEERQRELEELKQFQKDCQHYETLKAELQRERQNPQASPRLIVQIQGELAFRLKTLRETYRRLFKNK